MYAWYCGGIFHCFFSFFQASKWRSMNVHHPLEYRYDPSVSRLSVFVVVDDDDDFLAPFTIDILISSHGRLERMDSMHTDCMDAYASKRVCGRALFASSENDSFHKNLECGGAFCCCGGGGGGGWGTRPDHGGQSFHAHLSSRLPQQKRCCCFDPEIHSTDPYIR